MPAIIIGALLVIPIIIIIVIVIVIRIYKKGGPLIRLVTSVLSVSLCSCTKGHHIYSCIYIDSLYFHLFNENILQNLSISLYLHQSIYFYLFNIEIHQDLSITVLYSTKECCIYESLNLNFYTFTKGLFVFMYMYTVHIYIIFTKRPQLFIYMHTTFYLYLIKLRNNPKNLLYNYIPSIYMHTT